MPARDPSYGAPASPTRTASAERTSAPPPVTSASDEALVRRVLSRYATAYTDLDVQAAKEAWPSVNGTALARAFDNLAAQRVSLDACSIDVRGALAHAACDGKATWRPKIGNGSTHTEARKWAFDLVKSGESWMIASAKVQNR
jgi:hypothetical protein